MKVWLFISVRPAEVRGMVVASVRMRVLAFMMVVGGQWTAQMVLGGEMRIGEAA